MKVRFLIGLMITYPFLSLARCASWILLLFSDQRALRRSAPPAFVQNAVLLWQRPMLVFWCSHRSWNVPDQIHRYESTCILMSMVEHWIRQWFSFVSNVFVKELHRMVEAGGALGDRSVQHPCSKQRLLWRVVQDPQEARASRHKQRISSVAN